MAQRVSSAMVVLLAVTTGGRARRYDRCGAATPITAAAVIAGGYARKRWADAEPPRLKPSPTRFAAQVMTPSPDQEGTSGRQHDVFLNGLDASKALPPRNRAPTR